MQPVHAGLEGGLLARLLDGVVHLAARLFNHLFNACRMDAAVRNQLLKRDARDFAAHRVKAGDGDDLGRVVDDQINAW